MPRKILAVIVAFIVATAIIMIVEMINSTMIPPPTAAVLQDAAAMREYMANGPVQAYLVVLFGYILAAFAGGFVVTKMGRQVSTGTTLPLIVGVLLMLAMLSNVLMLPGQPIWFIAASLVAFIPLTLVGHRFAR